MATDDLAITSRSLAGHRGWRGSRSSLSPAASRRQPGTSSTVRGRAAAQIEGRIEGLPLPGGRVGSCLGHHVGRRPPSRDRSSDRNEQHRAALGHHPVNVACPRRAVLSGTCLHLLIAGSPPSSADDGDLDTWAERMPSRALFRVAGANKDHSRHLSPKCPQAASVHVSL